MTVYLNVSTICLPIAIAKLSAARSDCQLAIIHNNQINTHTHTTLAAIHFNPITLYITREEITITSQ